MNLKTLKVLTACALSFVPVAVKAQTSTMVFFECKTPEKAEEVAYMLDDVIYATTGLPEGCYWVYGEKQADVLELIKPVYLNGRVVWVGKVKRELAQPAYSAGVIDQEMV